MRDLIAKFEKQLYSDIDKVAGVNKSNSVYYLFSDTINSTHILYELLCDINKRRGDIKWKI